MALENSTRREPFSPSARLMLLLGDQLIRDSGLAVFELAKNAYDADARHCTITLQGIGDAEGGVIVVEDDGSGMTRKTIQQAWLRPGTRSRLDQRERIESQRPRSARFQRLPLGEKGVGRFAVHKLGDVVSVITRAAGEPEIVVDVDWRDFDSDEPLAKVRVRITEREPVVFVGRNTGTRITVSELREAHWTRGQVRELHRAVTSICSPLAGPSSFVASLVLEPDPGNWLADLLQPEQVREQSLFVFDGVISGGTLSYTYHFRPPRVWKVPKRTSKHSLTVPWLTADNDSSPALFDLGRPPEDSETVWRDLRIGDVRFTFHVFDLERKTLSALESDPKGLKEYLKANGGVRVYRDGVRVFDFGEPGNDWLDLGGKRVNVPTKRIGNNQILGEVHLNLRTSKGLVEKTNREGFVENAAYRMFRRAVEFAIEQAQAERNIDKDRMRASDKAELSRNREPVLADLALLRDEVNELLTADEHTAKLNRYIDQIDKQFREVMDRLLVAASSGLNLALVVHELEKGIRNLYQAVRTDASQDRVVKMAKELSEQIDSISWILRQSGKSKLTAADLIEHVAFAWNFRFRRHEITFINGLEQGDRPFAIKANRRLIMAAAMNLIDNAIYWLGTRSSNRRVYVGTSFDIDRKPALIVADNGPGFVDPPEYLTQAFFTRKPDGMGLGLHLASEIMRTHGGSIDFPSKGDVTLPAGLTGAVVALVFSGEA